MAPPSFHSYFSALNCGAVSAPYTPLLATFYITSNHLSSLFYFSADTASLLISKPSACSFA